MSVNPMVIFAKPLPYIPNITIIIRSFISNPLLGIIYVTLDVKVQQRTSAFNWLKRFAQSLAHIPYI